MLRAVVPVGLDSDTGCLKAGKWADLSVVRIGGDAAGAEDRVASPVIEAGSEQIVATFVAGRVVRGSVQG